MGTYRSVTDYDTEFDLREALADGLVGLDDDSFVYDSDGDHVYELDWLLTDVDNETSSVQSLHEELRRLQVLKKYQLVDAAKDTNIDKITTMAARIFNVPMAGVSVIDLGMLCCFSTYGFDRDIQVPRKKGICSHTILSKTSTMILPNASLDPRFADAPIVKVGGVRFYAGVALKAPEGYNLGTLCILDTEPRTHGLSALEESNLQDLAEVLVQALVDRRQRIEARETPLQLIANTAHDMLTPLSGLQLALSLLRENDGSKLSHQQNELLATASSCSDILVRICKASIDGLREGAEVATPTSHRSLEHSTSMDELLKILGMVMEPIPKRVPLILTLHPDVPLTIPFDDIKIFRAALRLVTCALDTTECGHVQLNIFFNSKTYEVVFECSDTSTKGKDSHCFAINASPQADVDSSFSQSSVATVVQSIGGKFGWHSTELGFNFWFSLPLQASNVMCFKETRVRANNHFFLNSASSHTSLESVRGAPLTSTTPGPELIKYTARKDNNQCPVTDVVSSQTSKASGGERAKRALVIDDSLVLRKSLSLALKKLGLHVTQASDGQEGLVCLKNQSFDVVLCDFLMPVMDGLDCVKQFRKWERENRATCRQLIIGISAHADESIAEQGREAGMDEFMPKPIGIKLLAGLIESEAVKTMGKVLDLTRNGEVEPGILALESSANGPEPLLTSNGNASIDFVPKDLAPPCGKRPRANFLPHSESGKACLLFCLPFPSSSILILQHCMISHGWDTTFVSRDNEALKSLQTRNWDAVLIQDNIPMSFIASFRSWELANRVNRQRNVFLVSSIPFGGNPKFIAHAPFGFSYVLGTESIWEQMSLYLTRDGSEVDIILAN